MKTFTRIAMLTGMLVLLACNHAFANPCPPGNPPTNCAPPTGAILDLNGTAINHQYQQFSIDFVASQLVTNISFAFREDPAFIFLDDVDVHDTTVVGPNLIQNGGFESGPLNANQPTGWSYLNAFGAGAAGIVSNNGPHSGSNNYFDGAVQAYDGITQGIATTIGHTYHISFWMFDDSGLTTWSRLSTNGDVTDPGGNGADLLVYAGQVPTLNTVPEPATITLVGIGLAAALRRRRLL